MLRQCVKCVSGGFDMLVIDAVVLNSTIGEVSVMIAEVSSRGKGLAVQALAGMLLYVEHFFESSVTAIVAKVSLDNEPSLRFFKNKLGFVERRRNACFNEVC